MYTAYRMRQIYILHLTLCARLTTCLHTRYPLHLLIGTENMMDERNITHTRKATCRGLHNGEESIHLPCGLEVFDMRINFRPRTHPFLSA